MDLLAWIILFSLLGGLVSVLLASTFLLLPEQMRERILPHTLSFAIGALLGAAFLALLPHALLYQRLKDPHVIMQTVLVGLMVFFILEKLVLWRHCHADDCEAHTLEHGHHHHNHGHDHRHKTAAGLILFGDGLHNFVDGVLIAAAFLTDFHLGVVTSIAVATHEIPQEVGDFVVLLQGGFSRKKALIFNVLSSLTTVVGAVLAYVFLSDIKQILPYVLAVAASSFIYIAVADLIPGLHRRGHLREGVTQFTLIVIGILTIYLAHSTMH